MRLSPAAEVSVRQGHPWVFAESIRDQNRAGETGELAVIYDRQDRFLAIGLYDAASSIRVRILHQGKPVPVTPAWWESRLRTALELRKFFDEHTNGFRWINGESDGWPGLVLDRYGPNLVLKLYTAGWFPMLRSVLLPLSERLFKPQRVVLRLSRNIQELAAAAGLADGQILLGQPLAEPVTFLENGVRFEADIVRGQKTGFFLDQRENRKAVGELAAGREVLNCFSFSGGFSLYAAKGGAQSVTDLDISPHALASSRRNFALNNGDLAVARTRHELVQANAFDWLEGNQERQFGLIVLDPPSLAKREAERSRAIAAYEKLVLSAADHLRPGGILVACSCSAHVNESQFFQAVRKAWTRSGRPFRELKTSGHAPDHPATFPEAKYLKAIWGQS